MIFPNAALIFVPKMATNLPAVILFVLLDVPAL